MVPVLTIVVFVEPRCVRVAQRARGAGGRDAGGEAIAAEQVQVAVLELGQSGDVLVADLVASRHPPTRTTVSTPKPMD
ncbi:hypothetical protein ADL04_01400 [Streptomyces sp. NRRL B-3648]|nr:hypothetical protein ADL04_01400 [Streptomyces sp. NRRL B-3648]